MNNKGFMMAEVVVVASIVMVALTSLYVSYNNIFTMYNKRIDYYDVATLYELGNYRKNNLPSATSASPVVSSDDKKIYYVSINVIEENTLSVSNRTFRDYLKYLSTSIDFETLTNDGVNNLLVMERCIDDYNCKYAYLEVFDEESVS